MQRGAYFLHEQPDQAGSWDLPCIRELMCKKGVQRVRCDQCQYGQEDGAGNPVEKPIGWLGNAPELMAQLQQRCSGRGGRCSRKQGGVHSACSGSVAQRAAIYQAKLCTAILRGMQRQLLRDGHLSRQDGSANIMVSRASEYGINFLMHNGDDEILTCDRELATQQQKQNRQGTNMAYSNTSIHKALLRHDHSPMLAVEDGNLGGGDYDAVWQPGMGPIGGSELLTMAAKQAVRQQRFVDYLTGQPLPPHLCRQARQLEIDDFRGKGFGNLGGLPRQFKSRADDPSASDGSRSTKATTRTPR